jgi:hypothetical protein
MPHQDLVHYTIGFAVRTKDDKGNLVLEPAGSGVLVILVQSYGIVTAGHVISKLIETQGRARFAAADNAMQVVFLIRFQELASIATLKPMPLDLRNDMVVSSYADNEGPPDLAFLFLDEEQKGWMLAKGAFYNFKLRSAQDHEALKKLDMHIVAGFVGEKAELVSKSTTKTRSTFVMELDYGQMSDYRIDEEFDYFKFEIEHNDSVPRPKNYEGFSGAAIWATTEGAKTSEKLIVGIAFQQSTPDHDGARYLICHGMKSLMEKLPKMVKETLVRPHERST